MPGWPVQLLLDWDLTTSSRQIHRLIHPNPSFHPLFHIFYSLIHLCIHPFIYSSILPSTHPSFDNLHSLIHPCIHPSVYSSIQGYASFHSSIFHIIYLLIHLCIHPLLIHPNLFFNPHIHLSFIHSSTQTHPLIDSSAFSSFHPLIIPVFKH